MIGCESIRFDAVKRTKSVELILQNFENKPGIQFRIIHMTSGKAAIVIMLYQVMVWIARKCEWIEPQRINGAPH